MIFVSAKQASQLRWPSDVPTLVASFLPLQLHGIVPFVCTVQFSLNDNILKPKIRHVNAIVIPRGFALLVNFTAKACWLSALLFCPFAT